MAVLAAIYTAYLFAQAKARDLWQNPLLPAHLLVQAGLAGAAVLLIAAAWWQPCTRVKLFADLGGRSSIGITCRALIRHERSGCPVAVRAIYHGGVFSGARGGGTRRAACTDTPRTRMTI